MLGEVSNAPLAGAAAGNLGAQVAEHRLGQSHVAADNLNAVSLGRPSSISFKGGRMIPSAKTSSLSGPPEPGSRPPMSM